MYLCRPWAHVAAPAGASSSYSSWVKGCLPPLRSARRGLAEGQTRTGSRAQSCITYIVAPASPLVDARRVSAKHDRSSQLAAHTPVNAELRRQPGCHRGTRSRSPSCAGRLAPNSEYILPPRQPGPEGNAYREERYKQYASDYSLSIESLEMRADVVRYNQERRLAEDYGRIHQHIQRNGVAEARVQSWLGFAKSMVVLGLQAWLVFHWITLLSAHRLDGAMFVYHYMVSDQLLRLILGVCRPVRQNRRGVATHSVVFKNQLCHLCARCQRGKPGRTGSRVRQRGVSRRGIWVPARRARPGSVEFVR
ncbi:MAG: hypothetical protein QOJ51_5291, partial [Acidobacteriaceae bacterium]|nr:hypothetical protein [Acidobacteriaceae bacterium]